ncbi:MAG TPA: hypothetical protein VLE73_06795 [Candidatus Saccharimonadales bacterium]|nr:hypothetical protein [Candidatus Saccharimonadales bacterium]
MQDIEGDETRTNTFEYWSNPTSTRRAEQQGIAPEGAERITLTEHQGLTGLKRFFADSLDELGASSAPEDHRLAQEVEDL